MVEGRKWRHFTVLNVPRHTVDRVSAHARHPPARYVTCWGLLPANWTVQCRLMFSHVGTWRMTISGSREAWTVMRCETGVMLDYVGVSKSPSSSTLQEIH